MQNNIANYSAMLYTRSPELIHHAAESLHHLTNIPSPPPSPAPDPKETKPLSQRDTFTPVFIAHYSQQLRHGNNLSIY